eukprot:COSAG06_NODE_6374_length_2959_cov_3.355134_1_plen_110_part_10
MVCQDTLGTIRYKEGSKQNCNCFLTSEAKAHATIAKAAGLLKLVLAKIVLQIRAAPARRERRAGEERDCETVGTFHHPKSVVDAVAATKRVFWGVSLCLSRACLTKLISF